MHTVQATGSVNASNGASGLSLPGGLGGINGQSGKAGAPYFNGDAPAPWLPPRACTWVPLACLEHAEQLRSEGAHHTRRPGLAAACHG